MSRHESSKGGTGLLDDLAGVSKELGDALNIQPEAPTAGKLMAVVRESLSRFNLAGPLIVHLPAFSERVGNSVWAVLGGLFPSGSLKFISVLGMLLNLCRAGKDFNVSRVIASTSGNTGLAAATIFRNTDIQFHAVIDARTAPGKKMELLSLGAEVTDVDKPDPTWIDSRLRRVAELMQRWPSSVDLDQYANPGALAGHYTFTGPLVWNARGGEIDVFVSPIGTGGIFGGTGHYLRKMNPHIAAVPVDCEGSIVLGGPAGPHLLTGLGAHIRCANVHRAYPAMVGLKPRVIGDAVAFKEAHWLRRHEGIWVGGSSGAALAAVAELAQEMRGKNIVVACPDGGESYEETIFNPAWLDGHGISI